MKLQHVPKALAIVAAMVLQASAPLATAQTAASYKYAVSITVSEPIGSASALTAAGPAKPSSTKWSPCTSATALDQLNFTLKYDAGKTVTTGATTTDSRHNIYVIFNKPEETTNGYFTLVKNSLVAASAYFVASNSASTIVNTNTYIAAADNLGGLRTEILLGGNLRLEALPTGIWSVTAIVADSATVNFDDPATWDAWDVSTLVLGKPWKGSSNTACL